MGDNYSTVKGEGDATAGAVSGLTWILTGLLLCLVPMAALFFSGTDLNPYLEFPPRTLYVEQAVFNVGWFVFYLLSGLVLSVVLARQLRVNIRFAQLPRLGSFLVGALLCFSWMVAWNRWEWAQYVQQHTFLAIWISYILLMNVLLYEVRGQCPLFDAPRRYAASFILSGLFWWFFEFLNRFTQNWRYLNVDDFSPLFYAVLATLSFCTVLPSIWVTKEFISQIVLDSKMFRLSLTPGRAVSGLAFVASIAILSALPLFPDYLFAFIWVLPISLALSLQTLICCRTITLPNLPLWAISGLWCGVLWELWNIHSMAKWTYHIPFVESSYIFEMPAVGYAGYLPFGILCGMVIESLIGKREENVSRN